MNKVDECGVCCLTYENERRPHALPCGHTLCSACIQKLIKNKNISCQCCRSCHPVEHFPVNYALEAAIKQLTSQTGEAASVPDTVKTAVKSMREAVGTMTTAFGTITTALETMATALKTVNTELGDTRPVSAKSQNEPQTTLDNSVNKPESALNNSMDVPEMAVNNSGNKQDPVISAEGRGKSEGKKDRSGWKERRMEERNGHTGTPESSTTSTRDRGGGSAETMTHESTVQIDKLRRMRGSIKRLLERGVVAVQEHEGRRLRSSLSRSRSSRITLENGNVYLYCLDEQPPPLGAHTVQLSELMGGLDPSSTLAFLDVGWGGSTKGRVHIRLRPDTGLSRQFILLCTGQRGHSYRNTSLLSVWNRDSPGECVRGGDYELNDGNGGRELDALPCVNYRCSGKAGAVRTPWWGYPDGELTAAQFVITTRDCDSGQDYSNVFGEVESGLEMLKEAVSLIDITEVTVVDCGLVLNR